MIILKRWILQLICIYLAYPEQALERLGLHMCDLKWEHFGVSLNFSSSSVETAQFTNNAPPKVAVDVKLLDLDAVLSESSLKLNMDNTPCESDEDCDYFDCKGKCIQVKQPLENVSLFHVRQNSLNFAKLQLMSMVDFNAWFTSNTRL